MKQLANSRLLDFMQAQARGQDRERLYANSIGVHYTLLFNDDISVSKIGIRISATNIIN